MVEILKISSQSSHSGFITQALFKIPQRVLEKKRKNRRVPVFRSRFSTLLFILFIAPLFTHIHTHTLCVSFLTIFFFITFNMRFMYLQSSSLSTLSTLFFFFFTRLVVTGMERKFRYRVLYSGHASRCDTYPSGFSVLLRVLGAGGLTSWKTRRMGTSLTCVRAFRVLISRLSVNGGDKIPPEKWPPVQIFGGN